MPAKKLVSRSKKVTKIKSTPVSKLKKRSIKSSLPKVKLKTGQPVLVRSSIMYVFVSSLVLLLLLNAFPTTIADVLYSDSRSSAVLGENDNKGKSGNNFEKKNTDEDELKKPSNNTGKEVTTVNPTTGLSTNTKSNSNSNKATINTKTYDSTGNLVEQTQLQDGKNGVDIKAKTFGETGVESSYQFKDKNGSVVMLKIREGDQSWSKLLYNEKNGMLLIRQKGSTLPMPNLTPNVSSIPTPNITLTITPDTTIAPNPTVPMEFIPDATPVAVPNEESADLLAIRINSGGSFDLIKSGMSANTNLPVEVDGEEGKVFVDNTEVVVNPDEVVEKVENEEGVDTVDNVVITKENGVVSYKVTGIDTQKFLGLFDVTMPKTLYYTVDTNTLISKSQTAMQNLIDALSF